jgi:hypothetical protein
MIHHWFLLSIEEEEFEEVRFSERRRRESNGGLVEQSVSDSPSSPVLV